MRGFNIPLLTCISSSGRSVKFQSGRPRFDGFSRMVTMILLTLVLWASCMAQSTRFEDVWPCAGYSPYLGGQDFPRWSARGVDRVVAFTPLYFLHRLGIN
jgi:hypothetical protein